MQFALAQLVFFADHVVAQVVETVLVVGAVGDVGGVSFLAAGRLKVAETLVFVVLVDKSGVINVAVVTNNNTGAHAQKVINLAHPAGIALCQVIVDGNHVHAFFGQGVEVNRQCGHQRFALAGFHFGDVAFVENHAADQLDIEVPLA